MPLDTGDTAWVLIAAGLVLFMTPGLALFYGGMVRSKNVLSMLLQNVVCMGLVTVLWVAFGFSAAFDGDLGGGLLGRFGLAGLRGLQTVPGLESLTIPAMAFVAFQMMFAVITPALITGAIADRVRFGAWVLFTALWLTFVYVPVAHWAFSPSGWLVKLGAFDFAGGVVIHINAGIAALAVVLVLGRRAGWPKEAMPPHNLPLTLIGTGILWFGWFGFNAGSALAANGIAAQALVNTHVAAGAAMLTWLLTEKVRDGHATTLGGASGAVAGLVAITPCAGFVSVMPAIVIGGIAGVVCYLAIMLKTRLGYDDALDVVAVHLVGGIIGSVLLGVFAESAVNPAIPDGLLFGGASLLGKQVVAVVAVLAFSFVVTLVLAKIVDLTMGLRVNEADEQIGLDTSQHAESAYNLGGLSAMERIL